MRLRGIAAMMSRKARYEMPPSYLIEPIGLETIERAFPLANAVIPTLSKYEWMQSCHCSSVAEGGCAARREREDIVIARNTHGYVKGICMYAIRDHGTYGRLVDVPLFIAFSAADGEGVVEELIDFLMGKCDGSVCCGIRFWEMNRETWEDRHSPSYIERSDHGLFLPALAGAEILKPLRAQVLSIAQTINRLSR
jgi:hypothetical protein